MQDKTQTFTGSTTNDSVPTRIETDHHVIHLEPRMSAPKLAEYLVADASRQETIVRQAKRGSKAIMIPYTRVRNVFGEALTLAGLDANLLIGRAKEIAELKSNNTWQQDDNTRSAEALRRLAEMAPTLDCARGEKIHRPSDGWPALKLNGVRVSVQPELVFLCDHRGIKKVGGIILNTGKSESLSLARNNGRYSAGDYLAVLLYQMLDSRLKDWGVPLHTHCRAIDIFRQTVYCAPSSFKTLLKNTDAACRTIALQWNAIEIGADEELIEA